MKYLILLLAVAGLLLLYALYPDRQPQQAGAGSEAVMPAPGTQLPEAPPPMEHGPPAKAVLDISVHTAEELAVLLERVEQLAMTPRPRGEEASIVLVLHGPEVEFFSIKNYHKYRDIVDRAARLDAFDIVDVKICRTMMNIRGIDRDDIPSFIEQVPLGTDEVDRLVSEGYVYF
ncbi:MAG: DsrE family protein [Gammaproteobacteria bacterium]|jgi:intracellular sulfur oxidation DsrE/DsrF family protein